MSVTAVDAATAHIELVGIDLYRDVHKGIRNELFAVTGAIGMLDASDGIGATSVMRRIEGFFELLHAHAEHEELVIGPVLAQIDRSLDERVREEHARLERSMAIIGRLGADAYTASHGAEPVAVRVAVRRWYLAVASFCADYLAHEATEELAVSPALTTALGEHGVAELEQAIVGSIAPDHFAGYLRLILPAVNPTERADLLRGIRAGAPAEVLSATLAIAEEVLVPEQLVALVADLDLDLAGAVDPAGAI